jgi:hypothetical protein
MIASFLPISALVALGIITLASSARASAPTTPNPGLHYYYPVAPLPPQTLTADICIYGGTPAGVAAAVQSHRMGKSAILAVFGRHVGGVTSAGLTDTDLGKRDSIGGIAAEFYARLDWRNFRPSEAEATFRKMLDDANVTTLYEHRLRNVTKAGNRITSITFENGITIAAKMFIDATYEGDLMAAAGVTYHVGREDNALYGEHYDGYRIAVGHQFRYPLDPYVTPGDPSSGVLKGISTDKPRTTGTGDSRIQAYNFRMWAAPIPNCLPWPKPDGYDASDYALLLRYLQTPDSVWRFDYSTGPLKLNPGDCNNAGPCSTDFIGGADRWPEASYAEREKIFQAHVTYQQGLMWFLAHDAAVPQRIHTIAQQFGLPRDEFAETNGWPYELYVREGRRMVSDYVMREQNCTGESIAPESIGLASYTMDSHNTSRVIIDGVVRAEGNIEVPIPGPYPISYRSIIPHETECGNLLVPVALSATHIAFGSIRMEPVFMILGQSAATAGALAIDQQSDVQKISYHQLRDRLIADLQKLAPLKEVAVPANKIAW